MNKILFLIIALFPIISSAALFGPNSYEECMDDDKSGKTSIEIRLLSNKCRNDFPMLPKLSKKRDANLVCRDDNEKSIYNINIKGKKVVLLENSKVLLSKTSHSKDRLTFKGNSADKDTNEEVTIYGDINLLTGVGDIKVEYKNKNTDDFVYPFSCYEN